MKRLHGQWGRSQFVKETRSPAEQRTKGISQVRDCLSQRESVALEGTVLYSSTGGQAYSYRIEPATRLTATAAGRPPCELLHDGR